MNTEDLVASLLGGGDLSGSVQDINEDAILNAVQHLQSGAHGFGTGFNPTPGFVVKTADEAGRKYFLNICSSQLIGLPTGWTEASIPAPVERFLTNAKTHKDSIGGDGDVERLLRIPMYNSEPRVDIDHNGQECTVIDCVISSVLLDQASEFRPLKLFLCHLAINIAEVLCKTQLNPEYKLPKMHSKGKPEPMKLPETQHQKQQQATLGDGKKHSSNGHRTETTSSGTRNKKAAIEEYSPDKLRYTVKYLGKPVETVRISVHLPSNGIITTTTTPTATRSIQNLTTMINVTLEQFGEVVKFDIAGCEPLEVQLPFAVECIEDRGADLVKNGEMLELELRYKPLAEIWRSAVAVK